MSHKGASAEGSPPPCARTPLAQAPRSACPMLHNGCSRKEGTPTDSGRFSPTRADSGQLRPTRIFTGGLVGGVPTRPSRWCLVPSPAPPSFASLALPNRVEDLDAKILPGVAAASACLKSRLIKSYNGNYFATSQCTSKSGSQVFWFPRQLIHIHTYPYRSSEQSPRPIWNFLVLRIRKFDSLFRKCYCTFPIWHMGTCFFWYFTGEQRLKSMVRSLKKHNMLVGPRASGAAGGGPQGVKRCYPSSPLR